jgi:DNA polymerase-3 subunit alpha
MKIKTIGIIHSIRETKTKNNELMAFATLEDNMSKIDITLFPRVYNRYSDLKDGMILIVFGMVNMRNQLQIVVDDIQII